MRYSRPVEIKNASMIEEVMVLALSLVLAMISCWAFYEGWVTGEVPIKFGHATLLENPFKYWLIMGGYCFVVLPFFLLAAFFWARKLIRRLHV